MIYAEVYAQGCFPGVVNVSNSYPQSASPNAQVTITTNVSLNCPIQGYYVVVDIMPTGYTRILSTAAGPVAVNGVTTPTDLGPWSLTVVVKLVDYPLGKIISSSSNTIVIQIVPSNQTCNNAVCSQTMVTVSGASSTMVSTNEMTNVSSLSTSTTFSTSTSKSTSAFATAMITESGQPQWYAGHTSLILGGIGATIVMALIVLVMMRRRGRATPPPTQLVTPTAPSPPPSATQPTTPVTPVHSSPSSSLGPPPGMKFCIFCRQSIPMNARYCTNINCGKPQQ
ncbi:MAG TPA: hypothetical protein VJZ75_04870 [Candidatus Bathyarchaeia archaeon]|nr:hypothetical protein [Candidatus Bathyarchaeia archaeon]